MVGGDIRENQIEKRRSNSWIFFLALAIVAGVAAYFFYMFHERSVQRDQLIVKANTDSIHIADLDAKYTAARDTLAAYKGLNAQLDSIIEVKEKELSSCRANFLATVRKNKMTEKEYKKQIADLQNLTVNFQSDVSALQAENKMLKIQKDSLGRLILVKNDSLAYLSDSNVVLEKRVLIGSLLKPSAITVTGVRTKGNGKEASTTKATKATQFKVCFTVPSNDIALAEKKTFYLRINGPDGATLTGQTARTFTKAETGEEISYSTTASLTYRNVAANTCVYFQTQSAFVKGTYTIEIYQDGYLTGTQKFPLK